MYPFRLFKIGLTFEIFVIIIQILWKPHWSSVLFLEVNCGKKVHMKSPLISRATSAHTSCATSENNITMKPSPTTSRIRLSFLVENTYCIIFFFACIFTFVSFLLSCSVLDFFLCTSILLCLLIFLVLL